MSNKRKRRRNNQRFCTDLILSIVNGNKKALEKLIIKAQNHKSNL